MDVYTKRPRTPNDQYTVLTDEQVKNIQKTASPHFHISEGKERANPSVRANGRAYKDRFVHSVSETHLRGDQLHQPYGWIADGWKQGSDAPYDTCRGRAAARWGINSIGERTRSHFFGESSDRYANISMYCRPATNYPGPVTMKFGRAAEGYYAQKLPLIFSHFGASMNLNQSTAMPHTRPKTTLKYETEQQNERDFRQQRQEQWPEFTEYTDKYLLHSKTLPYYMEKKLETAAARTATNKVPIEQLA